MGNQRPSHLDTVVATKHTVLAVCWLAINQSVRLPDSSATERPTSLFPQLDPVEAQNRQRPQRFWCGEDLAKLTVVGGRSDHDMRVGERVMFKDHTRPPFTKHGDENDPSNSLTVRILTVTETRTTINVLWQDGTLEAVDSKELIPYLNPDEYDCWYRIPSGLSTHVPVLISYSLGLVIMSFGKAKIPNALRSCSL